METKGGQSSTHEMGGSKAGSTNRTPGELPFQRFFAIWVAASSLWALFGPSWSTKEVVPDQRGGYLG